MKSLLILCMLTVTVFARNPWINPPDTAEMITDNGYPVEKHDITTEDGYILTVFRIPYGKKDGPSENRPPIIVQHGIMCSSDCWVLSIPEKGLGYVLADAGFDVWIGNNRGVLYSQSHVNLTTKDAAFWDFSFHEMGKYDVPAMIDYIIEHTNQSKVSYIGHSQGTSQYFAMAAIRPEYNDKVSVAALMAPIAFLDGTQGLIRVLSHFAKAIAYGAEALGLYHVLDHNVLISAADKIACNPDYWWSWMCQDLLNVIAGFDMPQLNKTLVETIALYSPTGASIKQLLHFTQLTNNGNKFTMYDYGAVGNIERYGMLTPKEYDLKAITSPVILNYADNDFLARPQNVEKVAGILPNVANMVKVNNTQFNHIDFMWAIDVVPLVYGQLIPLIKQHLST